MNFNFEPETIERVKQIALSLFIGYLIAQVLVVLIRRVFFKNISKQSKMLITRGIFYTAFVFVLFVVMDILELKGVFQTMLGAAGVLGIVLGIASQTSIGNIVSGIFLISEKPFELGDLIKIGDKLGTVYSIDLLSIKLKTPDNLLIRIPNQTIISTEVINITKFPIRRMDVDISVAYKEDLARVTELLKKIADKIPLCLDEPEPIVLAKNFGASGIDMLFGLWFEKSNYLALRNAVFQEILETFAHEGIEIPFPHISLYSGEATKPFPFKAASEVKK